MYNLFRAEWRKIGGNYPVMFFLIWIFPIGAIITSALTLLILSALPADIRTSGELGAITWHETMLSAWSVPSGQLGRLLGLAFTAVVFAGEFQWGTWKNILTRSNRIRLLIAKFATICAYMLVTFVLMSFILLAGGALISLSLGRPYGDLNGEVLSNFAVDYAFRAFIALVVTLVGAGYAAVAAIFTRSILGGVVVGVVAVIVEGLAPLLLLAFGNLIRQPQLTALYQLLPNYNIDNISAWITTGQPLNMPSLMRYAEGNPLALSVIIVALWVISLIGLTFYLFQRQDITT